MSIEWETQQLRLSLFSVEPFLLSEKDWHAITDQDEAEVRAAIPGGKQYSGKFLGGQLLLGFAGPRVDIILQPDDTMQESQESAEGPRFLQVGKWKDISIAFSEKVSPFLNTLEAKIIRVAFGAILLAEAESKEKAYEKLDDLLVSLDVDKEKMREVIYRVNWPQMSTVIPELELNRITNWSTLRLSQGVMQIAGSDMSFTKAGKNIHAVRLEIDHNTSQGWKQPFEKVQRGLIFQELLTMARENAEAGERP